VKRIRSIKYFEHSYYSRGYKLKLPILTFIYSSDNDDDDDDCDDIAFSNKCLFIIFIKFIVIYDS
jgi:hypothetical protein